MPIISYQKTSWKEKLVGVTFALVGGYAMSYSFCGLHGGGWSPNIINQSRMIEIRQQQAEEQMKQDIIPEDLIYNADKDKNRRLNRNEIENLVDELIKKHDAPFYRKIPRSYLGNFSSK